MKGSEEDIKEEIDNKILTNGIVRNIIQQDDESRQYFIIRIRNIVSQYCLVGGRVNKSFIRLLLDNSHDTRAMNYFQQYTEQYVLGIKKFLI